MLLFSLFFRKITKCRMLLEEAQGNESGKENGVNEGQRSRKNKSIFSKGKHKKSLLFHFPLLQMQKIKAVISEV